MREVSDLDLTLVVPCYNEEPHLADSVAMLRRVLRRTRLRYELLFVDDCSPDDTRRVIREVCDGEGDARYIFHEKNKGRGGAFKTGFRAARGTVVGFLDIDLEVGAHYVPELAGRILEGEGDVAVGDRYYILGQTRAWVRHFLSQGYRRLCTLLLNHGVRDSETGCKFFHRERTRDVVLGSVSDGWFWDTEVVARSALAGLRIVEVPVLFVRRFDKVSTVRLIPDTLRYLKELAWFRPSVGLGLLDRSPIYWSAVGYDLVMDLAYRGENAESLRELADRIPAGASVLDLCSGTSRLFRDHLAAKGCEYQGLESNGHFVMAMRRRGIRVRQADLRSAELPTADYVVMASSLYHFIGRRHELVTRMQKAARREVLVLEPVVNLSGSSSGPIAALGRWLSSPGIGEHHERFDLGSFHRLADEAGATDFAVTRGGRQALAVFPGWAGA